MKIALGQINTTVGDITANIEKMLDFASRAKKAKADLIVFPELAVAGYPPLDLLLKDSFIQANLEGVHKLKDSLEIPAIVGFVDINHGKGKHLYNACAFLEDGAIKAVQHKTLLPTYDVFDEDRYFQPASQHTPILFRDINIGLSICEDIWTRGDILEKLSYQIDPLQILSEKKPELLINISASPFAVGKEHIRQELVKEQTRRHKLPMVYVNSVGGNDQLIFDGRSFVMNEKGELVALAKAFEEDLIFVDVDSRKETGVKLQGTIEEFSSDRTVNTLAALVLGTRDYMRKCGFQKAVIGLSGGIDSAVTAAIAVKAVGKENVMGIAMPSPFSSQHSIDDARELAESLGIEFHIIPIEPAMNAYDTMLAGLFQGRGRDVTEENIQARIRGAILMAASNKMGHLVLATGNKSELAVGYCTLYGDMCGGLAVISDLPKMMVYDVARYINEEAGKPVIPVSTIDKPPSAELRPNQLDQDSLPPYVILDGILHAYVEQRRKPDEIIRLGYRPEVVQDVINRIDRNEYKRKQAAPGLKVSSRAFGMGWRMPIAQRFREKATVQAGGTH
ncbi:MAG: NAD+ synthase [Candidatus Melainabacteria bacterium]|jgi:NAD+ synthase (glutamine-hydrolysing)|nr:NAD+ synthase [Candidatus Melainabacteria bacterium]